MSLPTLTFKAGGNDNKTISHKEDIKIINVVYHILHNWLWGVQFQQKTGKNIKQITCILHESRVEKNTRSQMNESKACGVHCLIFEGEKKGHQ